MENIQNWVELSQVELSWEGTSYKGPKMHQEYITHTITYPTAALIIDAIPMLQQD